MGRLVCGLSGPIELVPLFKLRNMKKLLFVFITLFFLQGVHSQSRFEIRDGDFLLDGKSIQLICGEMHYPRIPKEYWADRLKRARAMGLNTVSAYVFWNFHERTPGEFDFEGQADLAEFIRLAHQEALYVIPEYAEIEFDQIYSAFSLDINLGEKELPAWGKLEISPDGEEWQIVEYSRKEQKMPIKAIRFSNAGNKEQQVYLRKFMVKLKK